MSYIYDFAIYMRFCRGLKIQIPKKNYFSCYKQYRFVYLQRQEDNLSTLL